jgi:hypothetical protein
MLGYATGEYIVDKVTNGSGHKLFDKPLKELRLLRCIVALAE